MTVAQKDICNAAYSSGLAGCPLCIHSSLSSFGKVDGGAEAVIKGLLDANCTVMVPAFAYIYGVNPPENDRPLRNGMDYDSIDDSGEINKLIYSPQSKIIHESMGAIPEALINMEGSIRGDNPLNSFAAIGPDAQRLIEGQGTDDVYAPLKELCRINGFIVMMGVGLTKLTALHLAEHIAGRNLFIRWANDRDGKPVRVRVGSCSNGFEKLEQVLAPIEKQVKVGDSLWRIYSAVELVKLAAKAIRENPAITRCNDDGCERCRDAIAGGPVMDNYRC